MLVLLDILNLASSPTKFRFMPGKLNGFAYHLAKVGQKYSMDTVWIDKFATQLLTLDNPLKLFVILFITDQEIIKAGFSTLQEKKGKFYINCSLLGFFSQIFKNVNV